MKARPELSILLVDDDADLRQYWGGVLTRAFDHVKSCGSGIEAMTLLSREHFDIVLYDFYTADLGGLEFCRELKEGASLEAVSVILYGPPYVSGKDDELARSAGAARLLPRAAAVDSIIRVSREVFAEQRAQQALSPPALPEPLPVQARHTSSVEIDVRLGETARILKRRNQQLELTASRFQAVTDGIADIAWETDALHQVTFFYEGENNSLGDLGAQSPGQSLCQLLQPWFEDEDLRLLQQRMQQQQSFRLLLRARERMKARSVAIVAKPWADAQGHFCGYRGSLVDTSDAEQTSARLRYEANHDSLTGLRNARAFENTLSQALQDGNQHVLCFLDLDYFKVVNDTSGHRAGDQLLRELAALFQTKVRNSDALARIGGDEFGILLRNCTLEQARRLVQDLHNSIGKYRFHWEGRSFEIGLSIGLVTVDNPLLAASEIMSFADQACYAAKKAGRNQMHVYGDDDGSGSTLGSEAHWLEKFHKAMSRGGLCLLRQPIIKANRRGPVQSYEVLVRMRDGDKLVSPMLFLPVIERYQLTPVLDEWVLQRMLEWLDRPEQRLQAYDYYSINLSGVSICKEEFRQHIYEMVRGYGRLAERICFEITESTAIENLPSAIRFMSDLRSLGCRFSLDDFGTGFSSLAYLKNLPVDYLKIDGVFVTGITSDPVDYGMLESIQHIATVLNLKTIAEYVETDAIANALQKIGVDYLQGFFVGHPEMIEFSNSTPLQGSREPGL